MLELDIHDFYKKQDTRQFSNSIARSGNPNVGRDTWQAARHFTPPLLTTPEQIQSAREYFGDINSEWANSPDEEIQALTVQEVSFQIQEYEARDGARDYRKQSEAGRVSGLLFWHKRRLHIQLMH